MKKKLDIRRILLFVLQLALIGLWFYFVNQHELYSKEGYRYNKFNGLYFLCGFLAVCGMVSNHRAGASLTRNQRLLLGLFGAGYALASVMANYPVFEPFDNARDLLNLTYSLAGGFLVGFHILSWGLRRLPLKTVSGENREHPVRFYLLTFISIAAVYLLYFFCVAYPGYFTRDSFTAIAQGLSGEYDNTSPFWHTMVVKLCIEIGELFGGQGSSAVCVYGIVQSIAMAAAFAYVLVTLYQAGIPKWCIALVYGAYTFLSYNLAYSATMWKDIPFSIGALVTVAALYRILKGVGRTGWNYVVFAVGGMFFCLMRTNGWYSYLVMAVVLVLIMKKYSRRLILVLCAVLAAGWICNNPVLDALGVAETNFVEALAIPFQQISRVVADDCEIGEADMALIEQYFWVDLVEELYDPLTVDPIKFEAFKADQREHLRENMGQFVGMWLRLGWQHPWEYAKAWIDETQGYWNAGYNFWIYPDGGESEEFGIVRPVVDNPVADAFGGLFHFLQSTPVIAQPLYGIGFQVWILFFCFVVCLMKKREEFMLAIPCLVIVVGLWAGTPVFAEFRYAYPVFVTVPMLLSVTLFGYHTDTIG